MGAPMLRNLAAAGFSMAAWNRSAARAQAVADVATICESPIATVQGADVVLSMLVDGAVTRAVLDAGGVISAAPEGALILNMGSVEPECDRALAAMSQRQGKSYMDAPVSGGVAGAEAASLAILAGGTPEDFARARPVFDAMGRATLLGPVGSGQVAKLANQMIVATTIGAVAEAFHLAGRSGCDIGQLRQALMGGFADSRILELHGARMVSGDYVPGGRSVLQLKDLRNALAAARAAGADLPLAQTAHDGFEDLVERQDGGEMDHSAYFHWLQTRTS